MRVLLKVAYDGTMYCGSQIQDNGITIESMLNDALSELYQAQVKTSSASRTDAGVHAKGNLFIYDTPFEKAMIADKVSFALNTRLPADIRVIGSKEVAPDFHPRFQKTRKTYTYRILNTAFDDPLRTRFTYHYYGELDEGRMDEAAGCLSGEHDFTSFASEKSQVNSFVRTIYECVAERIDDEIIIRVTGNGFLYNMVRIIAGTLIEVGNGKRTPESIKEILAGKNRSLSGPTAPAKGLTLEKIELKENEI